MEFLVELIVQLLAEAIIGPLLEVALEPIFKAASKTRLPLFALTMILVGGFAVGLMLSALFSERLIPPLLPGASLVLSPLILGFLMRAFGRWREGTGHNPTALATFAGGAALGLGIAAGRLSGLLG
jgi:hypothetical protein